MDIKEKLYSEIEDELDMISSLGPGSKEHEMAVNDVTKLMDRVIEMEKLENEKLFKQQQMDEKLKDREIETMKLGIETDKVNTEKLFKQIQMEEEQKDRFIKNCITIAGVVVPSVITVWGTLKSFEFEKEGTVTTIMGRGFINKLLPRK